MVISFKTRQWSIRRLKLYKILTLFTGLLLASVTLAGELSSTVNRTEIGSGETIDLTVTYSGQTRSEPDFSALDHQFQILSKNHQSQVSIINGHVTANTTWQLTLLPKGPGKAVIPTFQFQGESSDAIQLTIKADDTSNASDGFDTDKPVFAQASVDKTTLYVQEQALLTIRLYTRVALSDYTASSVEVEGAKVIKVSEDRYRKQIGGYPYVILETRYALFPERSGELEIPALRFNASIADGTSRFGSVFDRRGKPVYLLSKPLTLEVKPAPPMDKPAQWLPTKQLSLKQSWSTSERDITVGEPVTRTLTMEAEGLTSAQLPPLKIASSDDYRIYPDQALSENIPNSNGITGKRVEAMAIVPNHVGTLELPEIKIRWWDSSNKRFRETLVPGETFNVLPAVTVTSPAGSNIQDIVTGPEIATLSPKTTQINGSNLNLWLASGNLILLLTTLGFAVLWWRRRTPLPIGHEISKPDTSGAIKAVVNSAKAETLPALREAIIRWARLHWDTSEIFTLEQVAAKSKLSGKQDVLQNYFTWIDQQLYSDGSSSGDSMPNEKTAAQASQKQSHHSLTELVAILQKIDKEPTNTEKVQKNGLQALYPQ